MKKYFLITQPPISERFSLLVDDINESETFGLTQDVEKCEYNRLIIKEIGIDIHFDIQVQTALSKKGITSVIPLGKYICIFQIARDELEQSMFFFDSFRATNDFVFENNILGELFSDNIINEIIKVKNLIKDDWSTEKDSVRLLLFED